MEKTCKVSMFNIFQEGYVPHPTRFPTAYYCIMLIRITDLPASVTSSPFSFSTRAAAAHFPQRRARLFNEVESIGTCIVRLERSHCFACAHSVLLHLSSFIYIMLLLSHRFSILFVWTHGFQRLMLRYLAAQLNEPYV